MTKIDLNTFMAKRDEHRQQFIKDNKLIENLRNNTPNVKPLWDTSASAVKFNDINNDILKDGLLLFSAPLLDVWQGLFKPYIYDSDTLWSDKHEQRKIALIIDSWLNEKPLTPPFFVKHGSKPLGLVADGKHRLTVAKYMSAKILPFMVIKSEVEWVTESIPTAILKLEI